MTIVVPALRGATTPATWAKNELWRKAVASPSLDLRFAETKSLVDATTGSNLVDFTRASSGTYVGSDGLIKTAVTNLLTYSEDFENVAWQTTNPGEVTLITGVADPAGGNNATTFYYDSGAGDTGALRRLTAGTSGQPYTFSLWARRRIGSGDLKLVVGDNVTQTLNEVTSTWKRFAVSYTPTSNTVRTYIVLDNAGDQFDIWGAQLEQSSTVGEYVKTTSTINSAPRFDHDPTTGESLGLLVEESRANLLLQSEDFSTTWTTRFSATLTSNQAIAPDGANTADLLGLSNSSRFSGLRQFITFSPSTSYTFSVYARSVTGTAGFSLKIYDGVSDRFSFNLTATTSWQRFVFTITTTAGAGGGDLQIMNTSTPGSDSIYIWGAQLEAGAFATSYIKNVDAALGTTRAADTASSSGSNFSGWYNQSEGTFFGQVSSPKGTVLFGTANTFDDTLYVTQAASSNVFIRSGAAASASISAPVSSTGTTKLAIAYKANDFAASSNGGAVGTDTSGAVPTSQVRLKLGSSPWTPSSNNAINGTIKRLTFWPQRLSDSTLQAITQ